MITLTPELLVEDILKTLDWYHTVLRFKTIFVAPEKGTPIFARLERDQVTIMLFRRLEFAQEIPKFSSIPIGGSIAFYLKVNNIQKEWEAVKSQASIVQPLHTTNYDSTEFIIQDCNGYHLIFGERA